jgi:hypothetical protein
MSPEGVPSMDSLPDAPHCRRCDTQGRSLIEFRTPSNQVYFLCAACVEQEDKREMRFSPSWKRSRRPPAKLAVAAY